MINQTERTILMVALDFPPCQSAGVQRTLKFAEYLADLGWKVVVLTVNENVYTVTDKQLTIPENITIYRCHSFDSARDFSVKGKYFAWSKVPDRWWSWAIKAIPLGKKLIERYQPDIIWSTYPVTTAHFIAYKLQQFSKLPWVADYRDPLQCRYDNNVLKYSTLPKWIEKKTIQNCSKAVFTTQRAAQLYQRLYPDEKLTKFTVIENGFDEGNFKDILMGVNEHSEKFSLLHSGSIYPNGRDPQALFEAISYLKREKVLSRDNFELVFRGASSSQYIISLTEGDILDLVYFKKAISYKESLEEMINSSALLLIQGNLFINQIPGKAYEYIRCQKPMLAITGSNGATGDLLSRISQSITADKKESIIEAIEVLIRAKMPLTEEVTCFERQTKGKKLENLLNSILLRAN
jgi:hypothetical protein